MGNQHSATSSSSSSKLFKGKSKKGQQIAARDTGLAPSSFHCPPAEALDTLDIFSLILHASAHYGSRLAVVDCGANPACARTYSYSQLVSTTATDLAFLAFPAP